MQNKFVMVLLQDQFIINLTIYILDVNFTGIIGILTKVIQGTFETYNYKTSNQ